MYPSIDIFPTFPIHTFGIFMSIGFILFFSLLFSYSTKFNIAKPVFSDIISFTLITMIVGRILYMLSEWRSEQFLLRDLFEGSIGFLHFLEKVFISTNYTITLAGGAIGFFLVFLWKTRKQKKNRGAYIDVIALSFLITAVVGYIGAFLGGQIYGKPYTGPLSIIFHYEYSTVRFAHFPLALFYAFMCAVIATGLIVLAKKVRFPRGVLGYLGFILFGATLFLGEFINGSEDIIQSKIYLSLNQLFALALIGIGAFFIFFKKHDAPHS